MTVIVGLEANGKVVMGADSIGVNNYLAEIRLDPKIFFVDEMMIGFCGSFRMGQLLQYRLEIPKHPDGIPDHEYLCTAFVDAVKKLFNDHEVEKERSGVKEAIGAFLVGYRGHVYAIFEDYQVGRSHAGYASVGAGDQYALGAMSATEGMRIKPIRRVQLALEAAEKHSPWVRGPFTIEESM